MKLRKIWLLINCIVILFGLGYGLIYDKHYLVILSTLLMIIIMLLEMDKQIQDLLELKNED